MRLPGDGEATIDQRREQQHDKGHPRQPQFLADYREQEIIVGFRQEIEFLDTVAESGAKQSAAAECDLRLAQLIARAVNVFRRPGVEKRCQTPDHIGLGVGQHGNRAG